MSLVSVVGVAFVGVLGSQLLRRLAPEISQVLSVAAILLLVLSLVPQLQEFFDAIQSLGQQSGISGQSIGVILRGVGIGLVTRVACGVCCDCGQKALGETVEYCGQIATVSLALPYLMDLAERISGIEF